MSRLSRAAWSAWVVLAAVGCQVAVPPHAPALVDSEPTDSGDPVGALLRELEVEIRASYRRDTLDAAAAATVIDPSVGLTEFGVAPDAVALAAAAPQRWPVATVDGQAVTVVSRGLALGMSADRTVGWSYDDISLRASVCGRIASVPLRIAQVWVRDSERWTLVAEHLGYAQPVAPRQDGPALSTAIRTAVERQPESQAALAVIAEAIAPAGDRSVWDERSSALAVWPGAAQKHKGAATRTGPSLAQSLDAEAVALDGVRLALGPSRAVAMVSAGVAATLSSANAAPPVSIVARLRGTFVVERVAANGGQDTWSVRMALLSAPITTAALLARTLGVAATLGPGGHVTTVCR